MAASPLYLDAERLLAVLTPQRALTAVQDFFGKTPRDQVAVPPRIHLPVPGRNTIGLYMPAATGDFVGVKLVHLMPQRKPSVAAEVFLYEAETGELLFWGDGRPLTALRTAAVSTAASLRLRQSAENLLVFGGGVQAAAHLEALAAAYPGLHACKAVTRTPEGFAGLQATLSPALRKRVQRSTDLGKDMGAADLIVMTTPAAEPLFSWDDVHPQAQVLAIGSATPAMNEVPPAAFLHSHVWVDTVVALEEAGDCQAAVRAGWSSHAVAGDLFDLLAGPAPQAAPHTLFKSVGHAAQDLAILIALWREVAP